MFTQEEFESAYEIISGFNNIRKQINDDPKLLTKLYEIYKNSVFGNVKDYGDVDNSFTRDVRCSVLDCYICLGYPHEYSRNTFEHFDLLTEVFYRNENYLDYKEYESICTSPNSVQRSAVYEKIFNACHKFAVKYSTLSRIYTYLLETDEYIAETYLVLIKKLAFQLSRNKRYVTTDGDEWRLKLWRNELNLNSDDKPEYIMKSDEKLVIDIESDFFDLIDEITSEFNFFVRHELLGSESISHYIMTNEDYNNFVKDIKRKNTLIKTLVLKDLFSVFSKLNHSINIDTLEGKILFLYQLKDADINPDFQSFNIYCYSFSLNPKIIEVRVGVNSLIKQANEMTFGLKLLNSYDFYFRHVLDQVDKELSKKYMVLLYRFASVVAKADGKITEEEEEWLSQMLALTEADNERDEEQPDSRISQGGSNPIEELESLIGLESVKKDVVSLANFIKMKKMREEKGLKAPNISYHCVFSGNPGTGKTTVARILANIFKELGILKIGHLVETDRSGLVAEYVGQTAVKTNKIIDSALDGVLFVDEAYTLVGGQNDYGKEAIATLLKRMEDDRDRLVVILAGYSKDMEDFINSNPGLRSRFNRYINFPDYTSSELFDIFQLNASKNEYVISEEANQYLKKRLDMVVQNKQKDFGNARYIRNYFELAIEHQANRLAVELNLTPEMLCELAIDDIDIDT
jgi:SpoVK/Ycf46/Vps4 family AAA+-type ATPase